MDRKDLILNHCVELTCPSCGHMVRVGRFQCDLDAELFAAIYRRDIELYDLPCPHCKQPYGNPEAAQRVNRCGDWLKEACPCGRQQEAV